MIILWEGHSGLGNRLFISAYGLALAQATGQKLINLHLDRYENDFPGTRPSVRLAPLRYPLYHALRLLIKVLYRLPGGKRFFVMFAPDGGNSGYCSPANEAFISELRRRSVTFIRGWPWLERIQFPATDLIRRKLSPDSEVTEKAKQDAELARRTADVLVGVHIRGGDYRTFLDGRHFYETKQYLAIMDTMARLLAPKRVAFLLCSNETQRPEDFLPHSVTLGPGTLLGDMFALAYCDYIIGPPSTYSLWAAFHGRKPICLLTKPDPPADLSSFKIPDGTFEVMVTR